MKIAFVANTGWYLFNFRLNLVKALRSAGHEVTLITPPDAYSERMVSSGLKWLPLRIYRRSLNPFMEMKTVLELRQILASENIELVHGFTIKGAVYGSIAGFLAGVSRRVSSIDGLGYTFASSDLRARLLRPLVRSLLGLSLSGSRSRLILQNRDDVDLFVSNRIINANKIHLIAGAGVDCGKFTAGGRRGVGQPLRVLLASRLLWQKGIGEYVESARMLKSQGRNIEFLLAGTPDMGNPDSVSEEEVKSWVDEGVIQWLGHVDNISQLLATVHIVTLPSAYREGLPTCLTEAAACGLPLITTDNPGCREVVTHEVDGLIVPIREPKALANSIARLDDDPVLMERLGIAARSKALSQFDETVVVKQTLGVYREIVQ